MVRLSGVCAEGAVPRSPQHRGTGVLSKGTRGRSASPRSGTSLAGLRAHGSAGRAPAVPRRGAGCAAGRRLCLFTSPPGALARGGPAAAALCKRPGRGGPGDVARLLPGRVPAAGGAVRPRGALGPCPAGLRGAAGRERCGSAGRGEVRAALFFVSALH